ncbi:conserved hypothetical protein [Sporisorium reilianum SRZ2]|uniref:Uncharacterized protein n=1 Tax=Sporisorium reilianum (strain SRZ2) TaxID=999809 RepID=E6ZN63_SPORE|nr:conserved hypothetical protein [Sporisorium reilianum SRZ2]
MTTPIKRTRSGRSYHSPASLDKIEADQLSSGPSRNASRRQKKRIDDVAHIWENGTHMASLEGDTIDPNWIPSEPKASLASALSSSSRFLLRTGTPSDATVRFRLPFAGSAHALGQAINHRYSASRQHLQKSQFLYRHTFNGHVSCVNALAVSRGQGRWLASGGDDKEIHIRDLFGDFSKEFESVPLLSLKGHESNIFSLDWSAQNQYLFSTGNDSQILYYDVEHSQLPIRGAVPCAPEERSPLNATAIGAHDDSVPQLSAHPCNPNLLLSCDDGGDLKFIDIRMPHDSVSAARSDVVAGFSSVQWNPNASDGNTFAAATCGRITGSTRLYDVRQCFSSDRNRPLSSKDAVLSYHTALMQHSSTRGLIAAAAETNSICFDPQGRFLASSISRYHPTIYSVNDPDPLVTLESTVADDPIRHEDYYHWSGVPVGTPTAPKKLSSCCTIKHGSFGLQAHTGKLHYAIGSDDFRAYVFEIPDRDELLLQREFVNRRQWIDETSKLHALRRQQKAESEARPQVQHAQEEQEEGEGDDDSDADFSMIADNSIDHESEVAYCAGSILRATNIVRPARIREQAFVLCGGRSIINTALIHPTLPLILTAGIVPEINVHSAAPLRPKQIQTFDMFGERKALKTGGTRSRFLVPPSSRSLIDHDSDESEGHSHDEDDDEDQDDDLSEHQDRDGGELEGGDTQSGNDAGAVQAISASNLHRAPSPEEASSTEYAPHVTAGASSAAAAAAAEDDADVASSDGSHSGSDGYKWPYRRTSSNERNLYGSPTNSSRDSESQDDAQSDAQEADDAEARESAADQEPQATVQDFLSAMRSDPMYTTSAPLDYHHDRHIGTYSLSHLSPDLLPADSSASSASAIDADVDANTPNTSRASQNDDNEDDQDLSDLTGSASPSEHSYNPYKNDGYGSTINATWELEEQDRDEMRNAFQGDDEWMYSHNGQMWSTLRTLEHSRRLTKQLFLFDELLRRDEVRALTAGFRKVPKYAGGEGEGGDFTCGSCDGRIDTDE